MSFNCADARLAKDESLEYRGDICIEWNNNVYSFLDTDVIIIRHIQTQSVAAKSMTAFMSEAASLTNQRQSSFVRQTGLLIHVGALRVDVC